MKTNILNMFIQEIKISSTKDTPEFSLNPDGIIKISGRFMKEGSPELLKQINDWIEDYICNPADVTNVNISLEYFSNEAVRNFVLLIKKIESARSSDKKCIINWFYEEGDYGILEKGEYFSSLLNIPFNFVETNDSTFNKYRSTLN